MAELTGAAPPPPPGPRKVVVWAPVWPVFEFFADWLERCWRVPPLGGPPLGLDWCQAQALAAAARLPWDRQTCDHLRLMEGAALKVWTDRWERDHPRR